MAEIVASLLMVRLRSSQSCKMRFLIAVMVFMWVSSYLFFFRIPRIYGSVNVRNLREIFSEIGKCVAFKIFHRRIPYGRTKKAILSYGDRRASTRHNTVCFLRLSNFLKAESRCSSSDFCFMPTNSSMVTSKASANLIRESIEGSFLRIHNLRWQYSHSAESLLVCIVINFSVFDIFSN